MKSFFRLLQIVILTVIYSSIAKSQCSITINPTLPSPQCGRSSIGLNTTVTGTGPNTYAWSTGATASSINVTQSGKYTVTLTSGACTATTATDVIVADFVYHDSIVASDLDMNGRLTRDGVSSSCTSPKACPGIFTATGVRDYDIYNAYNPTSIAVCATASLSTACGGNDVLFAAAYTAFDPNNLCTSYLADIGSSPTTSAGHFSFTIPAFSTVKVVVSAVNVGATCSGYTLYIDIPRVAPTVMISGANNCQNTILATANPTASSYTWSTGATSQSILPQSTGTYTVTASHGNNGCVSTASANIGVNPLPIITFTGTGNFCGGIAKTIKVNGGSTYQWATGSLADSITVTQSGNYAVTATSLGCSASANAVVTIADYVYNDSIVASDLDMTGRLTRDGLQSTCSSPKVCPGTFTTVGVRDYDVYTLTNNTSTAVCATASLASSCSGNDALFVAAYTPFFNSLNLCTNYLADIGSSPNNSTGHFSFTVPVGGTVQLVVSSVNVGGVCHGYTLSVDMPRNALSITTTPSSTFCGAPANININATSNASAYHWNTGSTGASLHVTAAGNYTVSASFGNNGCIATASQVITDNKPQITFTPTNAAVCKGSSLSLTANGGGTYQWAGGLGTNPEIIVSPTTNTTYTVTVTGPASCSASASSQVVVNDLPQPTINHNGAILSTQSFTSYQWQLNGTDIPGATSQNYTATQNGNYTVKVNDTNNCGATSPAVNIINVGIEEEVNSHSIQIYPNPASSILSIESKSDDMKMITVATIEGKIVRTITIETATYYLNVNDLSKGLYLLHIETKSGNKTVKRFTKE